MNAARSTKLFIFLLLHAVLPSAAQVFNNSIHNRSELLLNTPFISSTANNTVEWNCINKSLTQKCLVYHNDQWFHFTPQTSGKLYLNLSSQACRDSRGVQMIVIEGNPCEIQTYRILKCIPKIYQDDVFIELDSLKEKTLYLVNIDGYLGDFCRFEITLSDEPKGLPQQSNQAKILNLQTEEAEHGIQLRWQVTDQQLEEIEHFEIYRHKSGEIKSKLIAKSSTRSNALGKHDRSYFYMDTVYSAGTYHYKIIGVTSHDRFSLDGSMISFQPFVECIAEIPLTFGKKGSLQISIMDPDHSKTLHTFSYEYLQNQSLPIDLSEYAIKGVKRFWIKVRHERLGEVKMFAFLVDERNQLRALNP